jgi:hypothetical protein
MQGTAFGTPLCNASHRGFWPEFAEDRSRVAAEGIVIFHESATNYDVVVTQGQPFIFKIIVSEVVQEKIDLKEVSMRGFAACELLTNRTSPSFFHFDGDTRVLRILEVFSTPKRISE